MTHNLAADNSGIDNPSETISFKEITAIDDAGYVVCAATSAGACDLAGPTDYPIGFTERSTFPAANIQMDPAKSADPVANYQIAIRALIPGQHAYLQLAPSNAAIAVGDKLAAASGANVGQVDKNSNVGTHYWTFAIALEAKDSSSGVTKNTGVTTQNVTIKCRIISPYYT